MTARNRFVGSDIPSRHALDSPRRLTRWRLPTRESSHPRHVTISAVPSAESSSTTIASQSAPSRHFTIRFNSSTTLPASLKVG